MAATPPGRTDRIENRLDTSNFVKDEVLIILYVRTVCQPSRSGVSTESRVKRLVLLRRVRGRFSGLEFISQSQDESETRKKTNRIGSGRKIRDSWLSTSLKPALIMFLAASSTRTRSPLLSRSGDAEIALMIIPSR